MAFEMRGGWAEESLSITGAEYVEPSATELLKPGQRVAHLFARNVMTAAGDRQRAHRGVDGGLRQRPADLHRRRTVAGRRHRVREDRGRPARAATAQSLSGYCAWLLPQQRIGHSADLINIDQLPFGGLAGQEPVVLFQANLRFAAGLDYDWFSGGHGNVGEKSGFDFYLSYLDEVAALVREECPRPDYTPDLSQTDYLDDLDDQAKDRLLR
jgi:hypothetical protein